MKKVAALAMMLLASSLLVVWGVAAWSAPLARIVAGVLLAGWSLLVFRGDS